MAAYLADAGLLATHELLLDMAAVAHFADEAVGSLQILRRPSSCAWWRLFESTSFTARTRSSALAKARVSGAPAHDAARGAEVVERDRVFVDAAWRLRQRLREARGDLAKSAVVAALLGIAAAGDDRVALACLCDDVLGQRQVS